MKRLLMILGAAVLMAGAPKAGEVGVYGEETGDVSVKVWLDRPNGTVIRPGREVEVSFELSNDGFAAVYDVDTEGFVHLLFPRPGESAWARGGRVYRIPDRDEDYDLVVEGPRGIEYIVAVASSRPIDLDALRWGDERDDEYAFSGRITGDPADAIFDLNVRLAWADEDESGGYASDTAWFYVSREVPYPRYLVYGWYGDRYFDPWWDPYDDVDIFISWHWGHDWCRPYWWHHHHHRPHFDHWYVLRDHHDGAHLSDWKSGFRRDDPPEIYRSKPERAVRYRDDRRDAKSGLVDGKGERTRDESRDAVRDTRRETERDSRAGTEARERDERPRVETDARDASRQREDRDRARVEQKKEDRDARRDADRQSRESVKKEEPPKSRGDSKSSDSGRSSGGERKSSDGGTKKGGDTKPRGKR